MATWLFRWSCKQHNAVCFIGLKLLHTYFLPSVLFYLPHVYRKSIDTEMVSAHMHNAKKGVVGCIMSDVPFDMTFVCGNVETAVFNTHYQFKFEHLSSFCLLLIIALICKWCFLQIFIIFIYSLYFSVFFFIRYKPISVNFPEVGCISTPTFPSYIYMLCSLLPVVHKTQFSTVC